MSATLETYRPIAAEYRGLSRVFRQQVSETDHAFQAALAPIVAPLRARLRHNPKLRATQVAEVERLYVRTIPQKFRIGGIEGAKTRVEFAIREVRLTASWLIDNGWDDPEKERGLSVCTFTLAVQRGRLIQGCHPVACLSPHAIARRIERGADRSPEALLADIAVLSNLDGDVSEVATPSGGHWLGTSVTASDDGKARRIFNTRTWVER